MTRRLFSLILLSGKLTFSAQNQNDSLAISTAATEDTTNIILQKLRINSAYADYAAGIFGKHLYFVSSRPNQVGVQYVDKKGNDAITDIYRCQKKDSVSFGSVKPLPAPPNTKFYEGPFCLTADEKTIFISSNNRKTGMLALYVSGYEKGKWSAPEKMIFCNDSFSYCHPALSASGKRLYFSSDKPGGAGGMDIFYTDLVDGSWTEPVNAGPSVNTPGNELFPCVIPGALFFSRKTEDRGMEIFRNDEGSASSRPLPPPVNSPGDDFGIWTDSSGTSGYISSNRLNADNDDVFYFALKYPDFRDAPEPPVKNAFCYTFYEETSMENKDTLNMDYEWDFGDGQKARGLKTRHCYQKYGSYAVRLNVVEKNSGEVFSSLVEYELEVPKPEMLIIEASDTSVVNQNVLFDAGASALKGYDLTHFYWSFGDGRFNTGIRAQHRYSKPGTYTAELWVVARNQKTSASEKFRISRIIHIKE